MKINFLGGGASEGIPAGFCGCALCREARAKKRYFTRSQALIDGELLIDFPPDTYYRSLAQGVELNRVKNVIITHSHSDHFYPEDFYMRGNASCFCLPFPTLTVYASKAATDAFDRLQNCFPKGTYEHKSKGNWHGYDEFPPSAEYVNIRPYEKFEAGRYAVTALPSEHMPWEPSFIFVVERDKKSFLYATDTGMPKAEVFDFLEAEKVRLDGVAYDGTYGLTGPFEGHMNFAQNEKMREELFCRGIVKEDAVHVITHVFHGGASSLEELEKGVPIGFLLAHDGLEIEL